MNAPIKTLPLESLKELLPCGACKGYGTVETTILPGKVYRPWHLNPCPTCDGSGFSDHTRRECPHCGELVRPNLRYETYARQIWHPACLETVMREQAMTAVWGQGSSETDSKPQPDAGVRDDSVKACTAILESLRGMLGEIVRKLDGGMNYGDMFGTEWTHALNEERRQKLGTEVYACLMQVDLSLSQLRRMKP